MLTDIEFERKLTSIMPQLKNYAMGPILRQSEDFLHDCYEKIWKKRHQYNPDTAELITWCGNLMKNYNIDLYRKARIRPREVEIDYAVHYSVQEPETELSDTWISFVQRLTEQERIFIRLRLEGYNKKESLSHLSINFYQAVQLVKKLRQKATKDVFSYKKPTPKRRGLPTGKLSLDTQISYFNFDKYQAPVTPVFIPEYIVTFTQPSVETEVIIVKPVEASVIIIVEACNAPINQSPKSRQTQNYFLRHRGL